MSDKRFTTDEIIESLQSVMNVLFAECAYSAIARLRAADKLCEAAQRKINIQAMDGGLWFVAITASEEYLQNALRELHFVIEQAIAEYKGKA